MRHRIDRVIFFTFTLLVSLFISGCKPSAENQSVMTESGVSVPITLVATNSPVSFFINSQPSSGLLSGSNSQYVYTPHQSFVGEDFFTFTASNNDGISNIATVTIIVRQNSSTTPLVSFRSDKKIVKPNESFVLSWTTENASSIDLSNLGNVNRTGTYSSSIEKDTTFTITATGAGGTTTKKVTVYVDNLSLAVTSPRSGPEKLNTALSGKLLPSRRG